MYCLPESEHNSVFWKTNTILLLAVWSVAAKQTFLAVPKDVLTEEGADVVLRCQIQNVQGMVQWTKDGFALGKSSNI